MYPKMKYAPQGGAVVVANETEERALGLGWTDTAPAVEVVESTPAAGDASEETSPEALEAAEAPKKKGKKAAKEVADNA